MKISREERFDRQFVLTDDEIKKIVGFFDQSDCIVYKAICTDKNVREFSSVDQLVQYENAPGKEIESLEITVFAKSQERKAYLFLSRRSSDNVSLSLKGEEEEVIKIRESILERFSAMSPWYAFISRIRYSGTVISILITWIFAIPLARIVNRTFFNNDLSSTQNLTIFCIILMAFSLIINLVWDRIRSSYFSAGTFAIMQGAKRHKNKDTIRTVVIAGSLISLVTGVLITLLW